MSRLMTPLGKAFNPGRLRHQLALQQDGAAVTTRDSYGQMTPAVATQTTVWGLVEPLSGDELVQAQQIVAEATHRITIRYAAGLGAQHEILFGTRRFYALHVANEDEVNHIHIVLAKELPDPTGTLS